MRTLLIALACSLLPSILLANQPTRESPAQSTDKAIKTFTSSADVAALIAKAKSERKEGESIVNEPMLELGSYNGHLEYRPSVGRSVLHEKDAEILAASVSATAVTL